MCSSVEREYLDTHPYNIEELFKSAQEKLVSKVLVAAFKDSLSSDIWDDKDGNSISPYTVLSFPERAPKHIMSIFKADLTHPIIVAQSNFDVLDGLHRLCLSILLKQPSIDIQIVNIYDLILNIGNGE